MVPFYDPFHWQEAYGSFLLKVRTGSYCRFDRLTTNGLHSHAFQEICLITNGKGQYSHGEQTIIIHPGDIILSKPNVVHEIASSRTQNLELVFFSFEVHEGHLPNRLTEQDRLFEALQRSDTIHASGHRRLLGYLQTLGRDIQANWVLQRTLSSFFIELLAPFAKGYTNQDHTEIQQIVTKAVDYIDQNMRQPLRAAEIANAVGLSERTLRRYFSDTLGKSLMRVVAERKLNRASSLLLMNFDIATICHLLHMEGSHFSRSFKKQFGISPRAYQDAYKATGKPSQRTVYRLSPQAKQRR